MGKRILLPRAFLSDAYKLILSLDYTTLDDYTKSLCASIEAHILAKFDAMEKHDIFTKYKIAARASNEREAYRREYLDKAGIHKDWISDKEMLD